MKYLKKLLVFSAFIAGLLFSVFSFSQMENPVNWKFSTVQLNAKTYNLIMEATIEKKWHLYSQFFDAGGPMPLQFNFKESPNFKLVGNVTETPNPKEEYDDVFEINVKYFEKYAKFVQKIEVLTDSGFNVKGVIEGQACFEDGKCIPISADLNFQINGGEEETLHVEENSDTKTETPILVTENRFKHEENANKKSLWGFFFISLLFGIIGILTPCVFPMIPMTVSFFMNKSESRSKNLLKVGIFGFSIMLLYGLVGVVVSLTSAGANFTTVLSTHWIPNLIFFLLFIVFAASLFGLFEFVMPSGLANKADARVDKGGLIAAFFLALTTVIVSFSCTGPIIGALLVKAASGDVLEPTVGMFGFGLGFALPFTILALAPGLLKKMPKSGGWLNSVKVVMGFIILAFSLKYFSNIDQSYNLGLMSREFYLAIWIVIFVLMGFYLLGKIKFKHDSDVHHVGFFRLLLAMFSFIVALYLFPGMFGANLSSVSGLIPPKTSQNFDLTINSTTIATDESELCETPEFSDKMHLAYGVKGYFYYDQAFECAKSQDKPVLLYFTGHSCANCKEMQASVWDNDQVKEIFNNELVLAALYVDERSVILPKPKQFISSRDKKLKQKLGEANADIEIVNFETNTQPYYVLISPDGKVLTNPIGYNTNAEEFLKFLRDGIEEFKKIKELNE